MKCCGITSILFYSLLLISISCNEGTRQDPKIAVTDCGKIEGNYNPGTGILSFKGIPYAKPPVGELRWKVPQPPDTWEGVRECKEFAASAMQGIPAPFWMWTEEFIAPTSPLSEDCLYLNIWTGARSLKEKRPVIVYIHGGGFQAGSGSVPLYNGESMAKKGVVFVTINYRLGIFGFLAHPELTEESENHTSGNYGILDQIESLKWVKRNIAAFGGDPENVTIAGQSAGAMSVNCLMVSPLAKGLFHRAVAESGGSVLATNRAQPNKLSDAETGGLEIAKSMNANSIVELRNVSPDSLLKTGTQLRPVIDGYVIPDAPGMIFKKGLQNDVPLLLGWNADEFNLFGELPDAGSFIKKVREDYGDQTDTFLKFFPADNDSVAKLSQASYSALLAFGVQVFQWMELQNITGKSNVYLYHFTRKVPFGEGQQDFGAFHSGELGYAYHNLQMSDVRPWTETDYNLEEVMSSYWVNFAGKGDPNGEGLPEWLPCKAKDYQTMILGNLVELKSLPFIKELEFLRDYFKQDI